MEQEHFERTLYCGSMQLPIVKLPQFTVFKNAYYKVLENDTLVLLKHIIAVKHFTSFP